MFEGLWDELVNDVWFKMTLLLAVAIASNFLFARLGQPKIIGQILLGILIGPSILGLITVSQSDPGDMVYRMAELGAIILLFMIGLECDMRDIYSKPAIVVATFGVIVPWVSGFFMAEWLLPTPGAGYSVFAQSMIIGAALVATSVAITAGLMKEMGVLGSKPAKLIIGAAVVDDILGMIVLAISSDLTAGEAISLLSISWIVIAAVIFVAVGALIGSKVVSRLIVIVELRGGIRKIPESGFLLALSFAFLYAVIAETIGISAIVGAFVAGTSLASCEFNRHIRKRTEILGWVFAPIFFLSLGILVDIWMSIPIWIFALILTAVAFATKVIGCGIPARFFGFSKKEALAVGVGMSPRMEVAMVIALYGLSKGIINTDIYGVIILMGLLTALFTPTILKRLLKGLPVEGRCDINPQDDVSGDI
ncbi:MAG TPA: cation:proton antiporter [Thermoplasmata archaeon]|nr:cation:proton antiporter [Thermoplasmata archaeon]